jgi:hypothetical protein
MDKAGGVSDFDPFEFEGEGAGQENESESENVIIGKRKYFVSVLFYYFIKLTPVRESILLKGYLMMMRRRRTKMRVRRKMKMLRMRKWMRRKMKMLRMRE